MSKTKAQSGIVSIKTVTRNIPLDRLVHARTNVRKTYVKAVVEARAASIEAHGLLQNLVVRAERGEGGAKTGRFEVTVGGTRLCALLLLAKRKKIAKDAPIPCNIREDGIGEELSLAENVAREALDPADEFEAFHELVTNKGLSAEAVAARFGVSHRHVQQRLKLAAVSPKLIDLYRAGQMELEQLMAFTVSDDPVRQEDVWNTHAWDRRPQALRHALLADKVPASDKRARFVGLAAYETAGGVVLRDLFAAQDDAVFLTDVALLERLAAEKLAGIAARVQSEGWKWVETALDFPHAHGFGRFHEREVKLPKKEAEKVAALEAKIEQCELAMEQDGADEALEAELDRLQAALAAFDAKRLRFDPEAMAEGGAFVVIGHDGEAEIVRGLVRPGEQGAADKEGADPGEVAETPSRAKGGLSDKLAANLTAHRTMALRDALARNADIALAALTHALVLQRFYARRAGETCLAVLGQSRALHSHAEDIAGTLAGRAVEERQEAWARKLPEEAPDAWGFVLALPREERLALLAHCVALSVDAVETTAPRSDAVSAADRLAQALDLDMTKYWQASAASYFARVSKPMIAEALTEAGLPGQAGRVAKFSKREAVAVAEHQLAGRNWLPAILRTPRPEEQVPLAAE